jgi:hypothetical protein
LRAPDTVDRLAAIYVSGEIAYECSQKPLAVLKSILMSPVEDRLFTEANSLPFGMHHRVKIVKLFVEKIM